MPIFQGLFLGKVRHFVRKIVFTWQTHGVKKAVNRVDKKNSDGLNTALAKRFARYKNRCAGQFG